MYVSFSCRKLLIAKQGLFPIARGDELLVPTARSDGLRLSPVIKNLFPLHPAHRLPPPLAWRRSPLLCTVLSFVMAL